MKIKKIIIYVLIVINLIFINFCYNLNKNYQNAQSELEDWHYGMIHNAHGSFKSIKLNHSNKLDNLINENDQMILEMNFILQKLDLAQFCMKHYDIMSYELREYLDYFIGCYKHVIYTWLEQLASNSDTITKDQVQKFHQDIQYIEETLFKFKVKEDNNLYYDLEDLTSEEIEEIIKDIMRNAKTKELKEAFKWYSDKGILPEIEK